ncbi:hypothetical protein ml_468 [Mollivirus sibericum]|uniref:hypothetical protein n=1 Tax=Mollivirus sibericum TaxID=1678078 RepID=UPI0006B2E77C|nr:hypothetical protein ml_468 [Mollivirus sibericum]ALD62270.1 hypothetical protein ml_468 [Mollivirus sibericum]
MNLRMPQPPVVRTHPQGMRERRNKTRMRKGQPRGRRNFGRGFMGEKCVRFCHKQTERHKENIEVRTG